MEKIDAINWMENWAGRYGVRLRPWRECRPGEWRVGLIMLPVDGEVVPVEAMDELLVMGKQLTFEEMGPAPAAGAPEGAVAGGLGEDGDDEPAHTNRAGRVTVEPFKGFSDGDGALFVAVDQFSLVGVGDDAREAMKGTCQRYLGEGQPGFPVNTYAEAWHFECGARLCWSPGRRDWCLIVTGRTLQLVGEAKHVQFLLDVDGHADHCTRVDPRVDDYSRKLIDLEKVRAAMSKEAPCFVGPRKCKVVESNKLTGTGKLAAEGATLYFGSRHGALIRFYDKGLESKGLICSNRLEVEYHKEKAEAAWSKLIEAGRRGQSEFARAVGELACGAIDFRERGQHRHVARMERLSWWAAVVERLGSWRVRVVQAVSSLNGACASMINQYGKKIARAVVVGEALGHDLMLQLVQIIDHLRQGQEVEQRRPSPLELAFQPSRAFKPLRC